MINVSDKYVAEFKKLCEKEGIKYETEAEYHEAANNLVNFVDLLVQMDTEHRSWDKRLETEPQGFALPSEGRSCSLCHKMVFGEVWYDKWGMKCMNCHEAFKKKIIPGYVFKDHDNEKHITDSRLTDISGLHTQTIRKLIRQGKIKARIVPGGPWVILRKENPDIADVIAVEKRLREARSA